MATIGKKLDELDAKMIATVDRWADGAARVATDVVGQIGGANGLMSKAETRLGDDFGGFAVKARRHAIRAEAVLDRAAREANAEIEHDSNQVGIFFGEVAAKMRDDLRPYTFELLRELDVLAGNAQAWIRTELSRRAPQQPLAT
jgi:hypothetical protein